MTTTVGAAKAYLATNFITHEITNTGILYLGMNVWAITALEEVSNVDSIRKRQFRLYSEGITDESNAWWEATQGPTSPPAPDPSFIERTNTYISTKIADETIKFGYVTQYLVESKKALCIAIMPDKSTKTILLTEGEIGEFTLEVL